MPDLLISVVTILDDKFKLDLKPILTMQHKGSRRRICYSLSPNFVSPCPLNVGVQGLATEPR